MTEPVKVGQYREIEGTSIGRVTGRNGDDSAWLFDRIDKDGGTVSGVGVIDKNIGPVISRNEAIARGVKRLKIKASSFFAE